MHVLLQVFLPAAREGQGREYSGAQKEYTGSLQERDPDGGEEAPQGGHLERLSPHGPSKAVAQCGEGVGQRGLQRKLASRRGPASYNAQHLPPAQPAEQTYNLLPTDAHKEKGERFLFPMWRASNQAKFNLHNPPMRNSSSPTRKVGRCSDLLKIILSFLQLGRIPSARCSRSCVRRQAAPSRQIIQLGMVLQFFVDCSVAFAVWSSTRALNIKTSEIIKFCPDFC